MNTDAPQWEAAAAGSKVGSVLCHDRAAAFAEISHKALIGDHVCTCDPS